MNTVDSSWAGHERGAPEYRRIVIALFAAGFATFAQIFDTQAILPAFSADMGVAPSSAALTVSAATLGVAASVLPWALVADRIGRAAAMKISMLSATALAFVAPLLPTFEGIIASRALLGLALGAVPGVAIAFLAEELVRGRVAVAAGIFIAGNTFGGICGRLIAGPVSQTLGWRLALLIVSGICALFAVVFVLVLPPSRGFRPEAPQPYRLSIRTLFHLRDPKMIGLYAQGMLLMGSFAAVYNYLGYHLELPPFSAPPTLVSLLFAAYLFGTLASRVSGSVVARVGPLAAILSGIALMLCGLALMLTPSLLGVTVGLIVFTIGCFSAHPVASGLTGPEAQLGRAQATALYQLSWLSGTAIFGWVAGVVLDRAGWPSMVGLAACLCAASALFAVGGLRWFAHRRPAPPSMRR